MVIHITLLNSYIRWTQICRTENEWRLGDLLSMQMNIIANTLLVAKCSTFVYSNLHYTTKYTYMYRNVRTTCKISNICLQGRTFVRAA